MNWKSPIDCVRRGSITGGSQADARARTPPRLGGLGLAGIQSGYEAAAAAARNRPPTRAVVPTPAAESLTKSRRFMDIGLSFSLCRIEGSDEPPLVPSVRNDAGAPSPSQGLVRYARPHGPSRPQTASGN